jgi:hypothetical protein
LDGIRVTVQELTGSDSSIWVERSPPAKVAPACSSGELDSGISEMSNTSGNPVAAETVGAKLKVKARVMICGGLVNVAPPGQPLPIYSGDSAGGLQV